MKRRRKSTRCSTNHHTNSDGNTQISDLPSAVLVEIFLKLPTKIIAMCKSVCKTWLILISDREFVKIHLAQAKECTLIRDLRVDTISRSFYLFEEDEFRWEYCKTDKTRLKVPLRNAHHMFGILENNNDSVFCIKSRSKSKNIVVMQTPRDYHRYTVLSSCHGLLCLSAPEWCNNPIVVCNPVTGEFMYLPYNPPQATAKLKALGIGFSPKDNAYKVVRVIHQRSSGPGSKYVDVAEIHTLGTEAWRKLDSWPSKFLRSQSYLDGALYWIHDQSNGNDCMVSFDLNEEQLHVHSLPFRGLHSPFSLSVRGGQFYMYNASDKTHVDIWLMNENGDPMNWTKLVTIDFSQLQSGRVNYHLVHINLERCMNNRAVVLFDNRGELIYYDALNGLRFKQLNIRGCKSYFEAVSYTPSFISLKDIDGMGNVEILNISSRCGKMKLVEESRRRGRSYF